MQPTLEKVPLTAERQYLFWIRSEPRFPFRWHYHPEYELTLLTRGRGTRVVGDRVEAYAEGDLVLIGPNLPHTWSGEAPVRHEAYVLQFAPALFGDGLLRQPDLARLAGLLERSRRGLRFGGRARDEAERLMRASYRERGIKRFARLLELFDVLAGAREVATLSAGAANAPPPARQGSEMERIYRFLHEHAAEPLGLAAVARRFNVTPSTLHRRLKRATGRSLTELVNEIRISRACGLLVSGDAPIAEICFECGYQNLSYFNRRFRASRGMSPRVYRRQMLGEAA